MFRIVQETLTNVLRPVGPDGRVALSLRYRPGAVGVEVTDDGGGRLATEAVRASGTGHGLVGMRERVAVHGGQLHRRTAPGRRLGTDREGAVGVIRVVIVDDQTYLVSSRVRRPDCRRCWAPLLGVAHVTTPVRSMDFRGTVEAQLTDLLGRTKADELMRPQ